MGGLVLSGLVREEANHRVFIVVNLSLKMLTVVGQPSADPTSSNQGRI